MTNFSRMLARFLEGPQDSPPFRAIFGVRTVDDLEGLFAAEAQPLRGLVYSGFAFPFQPRQHFLYVPQPPAGARNPEISGRTVQNLFHPQASLFPSQRSIRGLPPTAWLDPKAFRAFCPKAANPLADRIALGSDSAVASRLGYGFPGSHQQDSSGSPPQIGLGRVFNPLLELGFLIIGERNRAIHRHLRPIGMTPMLPLPK